MFSRGLMESSKQGAAFGGEAVFLHAAVGFSGMVRSMRSEARAGGVLSIQPSGRVQGFHIGKAVGINADLSRGRDGVIAVDEGVQNGFETTAVQGILGVRTRRPASFAKESWRSSKERKWSA